MSAKDSDGSELEESVASAEGVTWVGFILQRLTALG